MNQELAKILADAEGRFFDEGEAAGLVGYADTLLARLDTLQAVERAEEAILDDVVHTVMGHFPELTKVHGPETDKRVRRDQMMVLRYAAFGMVMQDPQFVYDKIACWLRSIMYALCDVRQVVAGYDALIGALHTHLTAEDAALMERYVRVVLNEFQQHEERAAA